MPTPLLPPRLAPPHAHERPGEGRLILLGHFLAGARLWVLMEPGGRKAPPLLNGQVKVS